MTSFADLGLKAATLEAVRELAYTRPTPVQEQSIPLALSGCDLVAAAKTGTGKTAAFSLPSLDRLAGKTAPEAPHMLVITPTRELAAQIEEVCATIGKHTGHCVSSVVGGVSINPQIQRIARGIDVLIATPGRLIDLMNQKAVDLSSVQILVLDEADRMLDMGFLPSVTRIVSATPRTRQTLLFSATVDDAVMKQVKTMLNEPRFVQIAVKGETADTVEQSLVEVPHTLKPALLNALLRERGSKRVIVFARTRHRADAACRKLKRAGFAAEAIHSDRSQNQRQRALDNFAAGKTDIIVATDVLARGIDVEKVSYVVNYDLPTQPEDYVHRIGRTGRAGAKGFAVSFYSPENKADLAAIEKFIKKKIPFATVEGFDLEEAAAEAAARATQRAAKNDPDIAQAVQELAKKQRRKEKRRNSAEKEGQAGSQADGSKKKAGREGAQKDRSRNAVRPHAPKAKPTRTNGETRPPKNQRGGSDMRPGRAHRAALADQRRRRRP